MLSLLVNSERDKRARINSAVVIPALNPEPQLPYLVKDLLAQGVSRVIVVNDGSESTYSGIFQDLQQLPCCTVLTHEVNRGKGRALKTAFQYFMEHFPDLDGVVTADADGQHSVEDICYICRMLSQQQDSLILGTRNFQENNVPKRSYLGNKVTSRLFWLFYGPYLTDTQTGLRGIPAKELAWMVKMKGERYDYEINMLIQVRFHNLSLSVVPIKTLYFNNNAGSHYSTVKDSLRIFLCLLAGLFSYLKTTVLSGLLDLLCFFILYNTIFSVLLTPLRIFASSLLARLFSSACNYALNRRIIFNHTGKIAPSAFRYYILWVFLLLASAGLVYFLSIFWTINVTVIKFFVDFALGLLSYQVQLRWVFRNKDKSYVIFPPGAQSSLAMKTKGIRTNKNTGEKNERRSL